jgi:hypothetical protein
MINSFHTLNAFLEKCYLCGKRYSGAFIPPWNVYAHKECLFKYNRVAVCPHEFENQVPCLRGTIKSWAWKSKHPLDFVDSKHTIEFHSKNKKRKIEQISKQVNTTDSTLKKFTSLWEIRQKRLTNLKNYCMKVHKLSTQKTDMLISYLRNGSDVRTSDFFYFRKRHRTTPQDLYDENKNVFESFKTMNTEQLVQTFSCEMKSFYIIEKFFTSMEKMFFDKIYNVS